MLPLDDLEAFEEMLVQLQAEEALGRTMEIAVGMGAMAERERRQQLQQWERLARGRRPQQRRRRTLEEQADYFRGMGFAVAGEPASAPQPPADTPATPATPARSAT